jgi:hypothetical protein
MISVAMVVDRHALMSGERVITSLSLSLPDQGSPTRDKGFAQNAGRPELEAAPRLVALTRLGPSRGPVNGEHCSDFQTLFASYQTGENHAAADRLIGLKAQRRGEGRNEDEIPTIKRIDIGRRVGKSGRGLKLEAVAIPSFITEFENAARIKTTGRRREQLCQIAEIDEHIQGRDEIVGLIPLRKISEGLFLDQTTIEMTLPRFVQHARRKIDASNFPAKGRKVWSGKTRAATKILYACEFPSGFDEKRMNFGGNLIVENFDKMLVEMRCIFVETCGEIVHWCAVARASHQGIKMKTDDRIVRHALQKSAAQTYRGLVMPIPSKRLECRAADREDILRVIAGNRAIDRNRLVHRTFNHGLDQTRTRISLNENDIFRTKAYRCAKAALAPENSPMR